jgi:sugar-specific transcriptional regulator TrmB
MADPLSVILRSCGLDAREAQLYLAGLQLGSAPASEYAKATGQNRVTAYHDLEELVRRGVMAVERTPQAKRFAPVAPEKLSQDMENNARALERALPELRSLQGTRYRRPHVRFYEGWEGVRRVYEDTLTAKGELLNFANSAVVRRFWPAYDDEYVRERAQRKIFLRGIAPDDPAGRRVHGEDRLRLREIRLVPAKDFDFTNEIMIYDHKLAICSFDAGLRGDGDMFGVIIESKEVAETQRQVFEMAWRYARLLQAARKRKG